MKFYKTKKTKKNNKTRLHVSRREQNFAQEKPHFSYLWVFQLLDENKYIRRLKKEKKKTSADIQQMTPNIMRWFIS